MGRYDKIKYWNGTAWVNPSQIKTWNGTAWVDYGTNDSSNTNSIYGYNGSGWQRFTLNKTVTNTSTLNYKYVRGQINTNTYGYFANARYYSSGGYYHLWRQFLGYVRVVYSGNCRLWGAWVGSGTGNTSSGNWDDCNLISTGYIRYNTTYNGTQSVMWSYQTMSRNAWHYLNMTSGGVYNSSASNANGRYMRVSIDNGTVYNLRSANGGSTSKGAGALYSYYNTWVRLGGTSTDFRGTITFKGCCYSKYGNASINVASGTIGSKMNIGSSTNINSATVYWVSSNNNVAGVYTNTSTTSWT